MKVHKINNDIYGFTVHLLVPCTPRQYVRYVEKVTGEPCREPKGGGACLSTVHDVFLMANVWAGDVADIEILSHECLHAAIAVLQMREIDLCGETEEVLCYLQGAMLKQCLKALGFK